MHNEFYSSFIELSEKAIDNGSGPCLFKLSSAEDFHLKDTNSSAAFRFALQRGIENLDDELTRFENLFSGKHSTVFWASDYNDVFNSLKRLFKLHKTRSVRLPNVENSTVFRELGIKYFLRDERIELCDDADMQFFVADMMLSDTGSLLLLNQTNGNLDRLSNGSINVFFTTIDRILNNSDWVELYQQFRSYNTGCGNQDMILTKGSPNCSNYLFVIDNQRTNLLQHKELRQALTCIQCGRCNDVCPVYQTIGDEPYNNVFVGPVGNIILPYLETVESYRHTAYACTQCGRCEEVCPISLPIRDMIIDSRHLFIANEEIDKNERRQLTAMRRMLSSRQKMNSSGFLKRHLLVKFLSSGYRRSHHLPVFSKESFNKSYKKAIGNEK